MLAATLTARVGLAQGGSAQPHFGLLPFESGNHGFEAPPDAPPAQPCDPPRRFGDPRGASS